MRYQILDKRLRRLPEPVRRLGCTILQRVEDPELEVARTPGEAGLEDWRSFSVVVLLIAVGLLMIACAFARSRSGGAGLRTFFYPGLVLVFAPAAAWLICANGARSGRIALVCIVGVACYFIKVMACPLYFSYFDEFLHWRTADDVLRSGHLFNVNSLLPVSSYYPGLEIVTNAFSTLSGLNTFISGLVVIGFARFFLIATFFLLSEQISGSSRIASLAALLYMANPHFLVFDSQFAYESLALSLVTFVLLAITLHQSISSPLNLLTVSFPAAASHQIVRRDLRWIGLTAGMALIALTFTHHITDFFFEGVMIAWLLVCTFSRVSSRYQLIVVWTAVFSVMLAIAWICFHGNPVVEYLTEFFECTFKELGRILGGTSGSRPLFAGYGGQTIWWWERLIIALAVGLILLCLPFGWLCLWRRYRRNAFICTLGFLSVLYPISQCFRFSKFGASVTDRSAAFIFLPLAFVLAVFIAQFWPTRLLNKKKTFLLTCAVSIVFLGGGILGLGTGLAALPGSYTLSIPRAVEPEGIQAALWAHAYLGADNRIGTDRTNQVLMGAYGDQSAVTSVAGRIDVSPIFFSSDLDANSRYLLKAGRVDFLVVDLRLSQGLPPLGFYFVEVEPQAFQHKTPIALKALTKFNTMPQTNRVFDSGNIVIYDVRGFVNAPEKV